MKNIARCVFLSFYFFLFFHLACESTSFHVAVAHSLNQKNLQDTQYLLNIDDTLLIKVEEELPLLKGIDIEISQTVAKPLNFSFYSVLQQSIENDKKYNVKEITTEEMHSKKCFIFRCAYDEKVKFSPDTTIKVLGYYLNEKTQPLLLRLSSAKDDVNEDKKLNIKIKPIFQDIGGIRFKFLYPSKPSVFNTLPLNEADEKQNISVLIDDKYLKDFSKPFFTKIGQHKIQVESHFYKSEVITCVVEKGKTEVIEIELKPSIPLLIIEGPNIAFVYLDDILIKLPFYSNVQKGEHTIKFKMEDYELIRSINVEDGKTYNLSFSLELKVVEN